MTRGGACLSPRASRSRARTDADPRARSALPGGRAAARPAACATRPLTSTLHPDSGELVDAVDLERHPSAGGLSGQHRVGRAADPHGPVVEDVVDGNHGRTRSTAPGDPTDLAGLEELETLTSGQVHEVSATPLVGLSFRLLPFCWSQDPATARVPEVIKDRAAEDLRPAGSESRSHRPGGRQGTTSTVQPACSTTAVASDPRPQWSSTE